MGWRRSTSPGEVKVPSEWENSLVWVNYITDADCIDFILNVKLWLIGFSLMALRILFIVF